MNGKLSSSGVNYVHISQPSLDQFYALYRPGLTFDEAQFSLPAFFFHPPNTSFPLSYGDVVEGVCDVDACPNVVFIGQLCRKHYRAWKRSDYSRATFLLVHSLSVRVSDKGVPYRVCANNQCQKALNGYGFPNREWILDFGDGPVAIFCQLCAQVVRSAWRGDVWVESAKSFTVGKRGDLDGPVVLNDLVKFRHVLWANASIVDLFDERKNVLINVLELAAHFRDPKVFPEPVFVDAVTVPRPLPTGAGGGVRPVMEGEMP